MLDNSQLIFAATESKIYAKEFDPILESTRSDIPPLFVYLQRLHNLSAMMWMPLFLILLPLAADGWHFRRHRKAYRYRNLLLTLVAAGDLLPLAGIVLFWLVKDNTGGVVTAAMWIFFAYLLLTLPRMAYYAVRAFGKGRATRILAPIAALGMAGVLIHGAVSGRSTLAVHRVTLRSDRLPEAFDGLRIAQFTDLHIGTLVDPDREMRALVDSLNALRPDLVIFCGDLVNIRYTELDSTAMRLLGGIRSRYGTFSITGNHDTGNYVRDTLSLPPGSSNASGRWGGAYSTTKRSTCGAATIRSPCRVSPTTARWPVSATIARCPATISARPTATCRKNSTTSRRRTFRNSGNRFSMRATAT